MGILDVASNNSIWRGYDYFQNKRVLGWHKISDTVLEGIVQGNRQEPYEVTVDLVHPKKSECNCPHAEGTRKVCKHKMALYFTAFPEEAERLMRAAEAYEQERERQAARLEEMVIARVHKMKKSEMEETLLRFLFEGSEWLFDRFVREYIEYEE